MAAMVDTTYTTKDTLKVRLGDGDIRGGVVKNIPFTIRDRGIRVSG